MSKRVPDATHEDRTEQVLERHERIVNAEQHRGQFEVGEEDHDAEVDQRVRYGDVVGLLVDDEND